MLHRVPVDSLHFWALGLVPKFEIYICASMSIILIFGNPTETTLPRFELRGDLQLCKWEKPPVFTEFSAAGGGSNAFSYAEALLNIDILIGSRIG